MINESKTKGFTLVELLVVISIIALLLSVLMPALQKTRGIAQRLVCATQLRQSGIAISAYLADNKDTYMFYRDSSLLPYPQFNSKNPAHVANDNWYQKLLNGKYFANSKSLVCPSHKVAPANNTKQRNQQLYMLDNKLSYGMSIAFAIDYSHPQYLARKWKSQEIAKASEIILITDTAHSVYPELGSHAMYGWYKDPKRTPFHDDLVSWPRHDGGYCNVIWADCHVSTVKASNPKDPASLYDENALTTIMQTGKNYWKVRTR